MHPQNSVPYDSENTNLDYQKGLEALHSKNYEKALKHFTHELQQVIGSAELFGHIALAYKGLHRKSEATLFYKKAIHIKPSDIHLRISFAQLLIDASDYDQAIIHLSAIPFETQADALFTLGKAKEGKGQFVEAIEYYKKSVALNPHNLDCFFALSLCYLDTDQKDESYQAIKNILDNGNILETHLKPLCDLLKIHNKHEEIIKLLDKKTELDEEFLSILGCAYQGSGDYDQARRLFENILKKNPKAFLAFKGIAELYYLEGDYEKAESYFLECLKIQESMDVYVHYIRLLHDLERFKEAENLFVRGEKSADSLLSFYLQIAKIKMDCRLYQESISLCKKALLLSPESIAAMSGIIVNSLEVEDFATAEYYTDFILQKIPDHESAQFSKAIVKFSENKLEEGWRFYEHRLKVKNQFHIKKEDFFEESHFWQGEDLKDKTIFVWSEQGIGDEIMFASCYNDILSKAKMCIIECSPRLYTLFARSFPQAFFIPQYMKRDDDEKKRILENLKPFRPIDYAIASGSLPLHFRKKIEDFPDRISYLKPDLSLVKEWQNRFKAFGENYKIGICWRSGLLTKHRQKYYLRLEDLLPLFRLPHIRFINLQYGECEEELKDFEKKHDIHFERWNDVNLKDDFDKVAAMMVHLDLIITAETAVGELGAALGVDVWRLTGGSDWTKLGQKERPWYKTMTSFIRVGENNWDNLIPNVTNKLKKRLTRYSQNSIISD